MPMQQVEFEFPDPDKPVLCRFLLRQLLYATNARLRRHAEC